MHLVVPFAPGGNIDMAARILADGLQKQFGQPFVVEHRGGAGGVIGADYVAHSAPDGYTLLVGANGPLIIGPMVFRTATYRWNRDLSPISSISFTPLVLQVNSRVAAHTLQEFIELARARPGVLTMASPGAGSSNHLLSELLQRESGSRWTTVHYNGNSPATMNVVAGQVDFSFDQLSMTLPHLKDGRIRALAISAATRHPALPDVPTFAQAGFPGIELTTFTGLAAPRGTPDAIVRRLSQAVTALLAQKAVAARFEQQGILVHGSSPEEFTAFLRQEDDKWAPIVRKAQLNAD